MKSNRRTRISKSKHLSEHTIWIWCIFNHIMRRFVQKYCRASPQRAAPPCCNRSTICSFVRCGVFTVSLQISDSSVWNTIFYSFIYVWPGQHWSVPPALVITSFTHVCKATERRLQLPLWSLGSCFTTMFGRWQTLSFSDTLKTRTLPPLLKMKDHLTFRPRWNISMLLNEETKTS